MDIKKTIADKLSNAQTSIRDFIEQIKDFFKKNARIEQHATNEITTEIAHGKTSKEIKNDSSNITPDPVLAGETEINGTHTAFGLVPTHVQQDEETGLWEVSAIGFYKENKAFDDRRFQTEQEAEAFIEQYILNCAFYSMETQADELCRTPQAIAEFKKRLADERGFVAESEMEDAIIKQYQGRFSWHSSLFDDEADEEKKRETISFSQISDSEIQAIRSDIEQNNIYVLSEVERSASPEKIHARRELKIDGDKIIFIINGIENELLPVEQVRQKILAKFQGRESSQNGLDLDVDFCGKRVAGRVVYSVFGRENAPQVNAEQMQALSCYMARHYNLMNDFMWSGIGNLDEYEYVKYDEKREKVPQDAMQKLSAIENAINEILEIHSSMRPLDVDLTVHRRARAGQFTGSIPEYSAFDDNASQYNVGLNGLTSTSVFKGSTESFGNGLMFKFTIPKGTPLHWIGLLQNDIVNGSYTLEENEVLLPPMKYSIRGISEANQTRSDRVIELSDPEPLNIYAIMLQSLDNIKRSNSQNPELSARIDEIANNLKSRIVEKHNGIIPDECKGLYASNIQPTKPRKNMPLEKIVMAEIDEGRQKQKSSDSIPLSPFAGTELQSLFSQDMAEIKKYLFSISCSGHYVGLDTLDSVNRRVHYESQHEDTHNEDHIDRVILNGTLLAAKEQLSEEDYRLLLNCLKYHDIGRNDIQSAYKDGVSNEHGGYSADRIRILYERGFFKGNIETQADLDLVCSAVTMHSLHDSNLEEIRESDPRLYRIASLLKDADNLDRVRLGDLDPKFLRSPHAKAQIPFAEQLLQNYRQQKYSVQQRQEVSKQN